MYRVKSYKVKKCSRTYQTEETKKIIRAAKRMIDNGINWKEAIATIEVIDDSIQKEKARKSIIDYIPLDMI